MDSTPKQDQEPVTEVTESRTRAATADDTSSLDQFSVILPENIQNAIITKAPEERFRLGTWSVIGLVVNRVIGTPKFVGGYAGNRMLTISSRNRHFQLSVHRHDRHE
jgi:hypothetical protein